MENKNLDAEYEYLKSLYGDNGVYMSKEDFEYMQKACDTITGIYPLGASRDISGTKWVLLLFLHPYIDDRAIALNPAYIKTHPVISVLADPNSVGMLVTDQYEHVYRVSESLFEEREHADAYFKNMSKGIDSPLPDIDLAALDSLRIRDSIKYEPEEILALAKDLQNAGLERISHEDQVKAFHTPMTCTALNQALNLWEDLGYRRAEKR